ncbi:MAG: hypothetical protein ACJ768_10305 [Gaiellaceae bacterium]
MDEVTQLLLSRLAGGEQAATGLSLPDVVEQSLGDDPLAAPLATLLRQRAEQDAGGDDVDDEEVADVLERLYAEVETLRERMRTLADALGACPRCFGDDHLCPVCHGRGRPGGRQPDPALFTELVEPARLRLGGSPYVELPELEGELQAP